MQAVNVSQSIRYTTVPVVKKKKKRAIGKLKIEVTSNTDDTHANILFPAVRLCDLLVSLVIRFFFFLSLSVCFVSLGERHPEEVRHVQAGRRILINLIGRGKTETKTHNNNNKKKKEIALYPEWCYNKCTLRTKKKKKQRKKKGVYKYCFLFLHFNIAKLENRSEIETLMLSSKRNNNRGEKKKRQINLYRDAERGEADVLPEKKKKHNIGLHITFNYKKKKKSHTRSRKGQITRQKVEEEEEKKSYRQVVILHLFLIFFFVSPSESTAVTGTTAALALP